MPEFGEAVRADSSSRLFAMEMIRKSIASENLKIAASVIAIKLLVVFYGIQTYLVATDKPINNIYRVLYIWKRWDAVHYIKIAQDGYAAVGEDRFLLVFYPLYPLLVAILDFVVRDTVLSAFLISGVASVVLAVVLRELVRLDYAERVADAAVLFLFIFPTSFVLHIPYTESLFLALVVSAFFAARKRRWLLAGVLGCLACTTRINGLLLFPALLLEVWNEFRETREKNWQWLYLLLIPIGVSSYLGLNYSVSGDPFKFLEYQREHWHRSLRLPWYGLMDAFRNMIGRSPAQALMVGFQELA
ncbi:MAG: mannosyltransferase family protein, partial [Acidobacteriota bacterium]|nr:mannosyltransferase family protein [Acidobacteriota bacterium]